MKKNLFAFIIDYSAMTELLPQLTHMQVYHIHSLEHFNLLDYPSCEKISHIFIDLDVINNSGINDIYLGFPHAIIIGLAEKLSYKRIRSLLKMGVTGLFSKDDILRQFESNFNQWVEHGAFNSPVFAIKIANHFFRKQFLELNNLPRRRAHIARELLRGLSYKEVAERNHISIETVRDHVKKIYHDMNVHSRVELMNICES